MGHPILGPWKGGQMQHRPPRHLGAGGPMGVGGGADGRRLAVDDSRMSQPRIRGDPRIAHFDFGADRVGGSNLGVDVLGTTPIQVERPRQFRLGLSPNPKPGTTS